MSWNKHSLFYSLKSRTALLYAGLFSVSFALIFGIVYLYLYLGNQETADRRLDGIFSECEYEYLTGNEFTSSQVPIQKFKRIPYVVFQVIARELVGFQPILAFRDADNARRFTLLGSQGRELWQVTVDADTENMEKKRIDLPDRASILAKEFASESYGEGNWIYFLLLSKEGKILAQSPFPAADIEYFQKFPYDLQYSHIQYADLAGSRRRIRIVYRKLFDGNLLVIGLDQHAADENLEKIANAFLAIGLTVLVLSALCGWFLARRMVRGMEKVARTADKIAAGDYSLRVPAASEGLEIDALVASFNTMTENTETLMMELRTIADDIAHDLRTPLTRMLGRSEMTVSGHPTLENALDTLGDNAEDCRRMLALINQMLDISKTASGACILHKKEFDFAALLKHSIDLFRMVMERKKQTLSVELPETPLMLNADPMRIQQVIANLLDNAADFCLYRRGRTA